MNVEKKFVDIMKAMLPGLSIMVASCLLVQTDIKAMWQKIPQEMWEKAFWLIFQSKKHRRNKTKTVVQQCFVLLTHKSVVTHEAILFQKKWGCPVHHRRSLTNAVCVHPKDEVIFVESRVVTGKEKS